MVEYPTDLLMQCSPDHPRPTTYSAASSPAKTSSLAVSPSYTPHTTQLMEGASPDGVVMTPSTDSNGEEEDFTDMSDSDA